MDYRQRLCINNLQLTSKQDWVLVSISNQEVEEGISLGSHQEEQSKKKRLNDRSFQSTAAESLQHSILAKQAEIAVRRWGGGTARVVQVNEFHDYPDVGSVNVRYTANKEYGLVLTQRDQGKVPMILATGVCPDFYLVGWILPDHLRQMLYKVHQGRNDDCPSSFGFLQRMQDHESCYVNQQLLYPMSTLNKDLVK